ncbi:DUF2382 domain-containing protein [Geodermatophilus sp. DSM 44513]|uniref:DUF2382 domain-containing protein n=1 Tax=Geodermatophilus sp. DSM 44513 TaxID=1528104 RepID=UPI0028F73073|nr:DUF2382 domain-containing protein [Geodermatophilus sp. DSM 44513]WNV75717.1 DUF2382 domain-containing protein [Geodermatophilus sp. DSM 44513]
MLSERELSAAIGSTAYGPDGEKIGTVEHFFTDDRTGAATWVAVSTGLFGTRHSVVPAADATLTEGSVRLPVTRDAVRAAPAVPDQHLAPEDEALLRRHYGLDAIPDAGPDAGPAPVTGDDATRDLSLPPQGAPAARHDTVAVDRAAAAVPPATADRTDGAMTRSEEQLRVTLQRHPAKRVRVVKYVVTEEVTVTVPVRREEIRVEELPLDADTAAPSVRTGTGTGLPEVIVLHAERPVVTTEVVPVERVLLRTEVVTEHVQVRDTVRRERVDVDTDGVAAPRT